MSVSGRVIDNQVYFNVSRGLASFTGTTCTGRYQENLSERAKSKEELSTPRRACSSTGSFGDKDTHIKVQEKGTFKQVKDKQIYPSTTETICLENTVQKNKLFDSTKLLTKGSIEELLCAHGMPLKDSCFQIVEKEIYLSHDAFVFLFFKAASVGNMIEEQRELYLKICEEIALCYKQYIMSNCVQNETDERSFSVPLRVCHATNDNLMSEDVKIDTASGGAERCTKQYKVTETCQVAVTRPPECPKRLSGRSKVSVNPNHGDDNLRSQICEKTNISKENLHHEWEEINCTKKELPEDDIENDFEDETADVIVHDETSSGKNDNCEKKKFTNKTDDVVNEICLGYNEETAEHGGEKYKSDVAAAMTIRRNPSRNKERKNPDRYAEDSIKIRIKGKLVAQKDSKRTDLASHRSKLNSTPSQTLQEKCLTQHECSVCSKKFSNKAKLQTHCQGHAADKYPMCHSTKTEKLLENHIERKGYTCSLCGKHYASQYGLSTHKIIHHGPFGQHKCDQCKKMFNNPRSLEQHVGRVHKKRTLLCDYCGKYFDRESAYRAHVKKHRDFANGKHVCQYCEKKFSTKVDRVQHERIHTGETPLTCEFCGRAFRRTQNLRRHILEIHSGILHECPDCGKMTNSAHNMKRHMKIHENKMKNSSKTKSQLGRVKNTIKDKKLHSTSSTQSQMYFVEGKGHTYYTTCLYVDFDKSAITNRHSDTRNINDSRIAVSCNRSNISSMQLDQGMNVTANNDEVLGFQQQNQGDRILTALGHAGEQHNATEDEEINTFYQLFAQPTQEVEVVTADSVDATTDPVFVAYQPSNDTYKQS